MHLIPASQSFYTSWRNSICFSKRPIRMLTMTFPIHGSMDQWDEMFLFILYIWVSDDQYSMRFMQSCTLCLTGWRFKLYLRNCRGWVHHFPPHPIENIMKKPNVNVKNMVVFNSRWKWEGERWRQERLHLHTLYQCLCTCSGILHRLDYTTPAFSSRASCENGDNNYESPLQVLLVLQNCAVKCNNKHNE